MAELQSQGKVVMAFSDDNIANAWIFNPRIFRTNIFVTALQMSANVAAHKVSLTRAEIKGDMAFRKCCIQNETLGHSLSQCIHTK